MERLAKVCISVLIAFAAGVVAYVAVEVIHNPRIWSHPDFVWRLALDGALIFVAVPVVVLAVIAMIRSIPSVALATSVAVGWLTVIFALWAYKPLVYHGQFPWLGFRLHYLGMLPVPLTFGLAFAWCARLLMGPNNRFERPRVAEASMNQGGSR